MTGYAATTRVTRAATHAEIEKILTRFGATKFAAGWEENHGFISFVYGSRTAPARTVTVRVPMPDRGHSSFVLTPSTKRPRSVTAAEAAYNQAVRARWRSLALVVKAMLVAVDAGILTFEEAFLGYTELPDGGTVSQHVLSRVNHAIETGDLLALASDPS